MMDVKIVEERFLKINKLLGLLTGVWPFQNEKTKKLTRIVILSLMTFTYITQFSRLIIYSSVEIVLKEYPHLLVGLGTTIKLGNYIINESKLKVLLEGIYEDWWTMKSNDERTIMTKYAENGVRFVTLYILHIAICVFIFFCLPFVPLILDVIQPLNESRKRLYIYPAHYFVDHDKYYYAIIAHMMFVVILLSTVYCACDSNYVYAVQHACGLLAISGYRFKYACHDVQLVGQHESDVVKLMNAMYKNVCYSIRGHQRALQHIKEIVIIHETYLLILVGSLMLCLSVTLLKIAEGDYNAEWFTFCAFFAAQLCHMLFLTIQGQFVMNSYNNVYNMICEAMWYNARGKTQMLYVLALRRCLNPPLITAGGFVTLNLTTFAEIIKASVSYYTVMQSK